MAEPDKGAMRLEHKRKILHNKIEIKRVLEPSEIMYDLISADVMTMEDKQEIMNINPYTQQESAQRFCEKLLSKGDDAYREFILALRENGYRKLAKQIEDTPDAAKDDTAMPAQGYQESECTTPTFRGKMSKELQIKINRNLKNIKEQLDAEDILDYFIMEGLIDETGEQKVKRNNPNTRARRTEAFLNILTTLNDRAFYVLIHSLKQEGYGKLAADIQGTDTKTTRKEDAGKKASAADDDKAEKKSDGGPMQIHTRASGGPSEIAPGGNETHLMESDMLTPKINDMKLAAVDGLEQTTSAMRTVEKEVAANRRSSKYSAGVMVAVHPRKETIATDDLKVRLSKSVGVIVAARIMATGFRVGANYIMTAAHVVDLILDTAYEEIGRGASPPERALTDVCIAFGYIKSSHSAENIDRFFFKPEIKYKNQQLDVAVLELQDLERGKAYPPAFEHFAKIKQNRTTETESIYFIGHSKGEVKVSDKVTELFTLSRTEVEELNTWSKKKVPGTKGLHGFAGIDHPGKVLLHCSLEIGSSGSPGLSIEGDSDKYFVKCMLIQRYPNWYYDDEVDQKFKCNVPTDCLYEQAVTMDAVFNDMWLPSLNDLRKDIFGRPSTDVGHTSRPKMDE